jgi:molybdopterin-guanine dinucleotide biosynthesis protein MobB
VVGTRRHVGKTAVLTKIIEEMKGRGLSVGTIKHIGDRSVFDLSAGKDTSKHLEAGSSITLAVTSSEIISIRRDLPITLESAISQMPSELDYILVEGFRRSAFPKLIVVNSLDENVQGMAGDTIALVVDGKEIIKGDNKGQARQFSKACLVDLIEGYFQVSH